MLTVFFCCPIATLAGPLAQRLESYPHLLAKPSFPRKEADLIYPDWMAGTWLVESLLLHQFAPFSPDFVTPGFKKNAVYLHRPVSFLVKFIPKKVFNSTLIPVLNPHRAIIADRGFNGLSIAQAYLGNKGIISVKVANDNPDRQHSFFPDNLRLVSTVIGRGSEQVDSDSFITCEISEQRFQSPGSLYINEVETITAYRLVSQGTIEADQLTAIYLSPQDPQYFRSLNRPVAVYKYRLNLQAKS
ncbi:MAG: hypothetical protein Cpurp_03295 [Chlorogloea purpurea SAG 13.99]|nr:hypothetical protein [Chlorogloea purpurea SAG 13.99]